MTEQQLQSKIIKYLKEEGWEVGKIMVMSEPGWPDLICCRGGDTVFIEVKKPGGKLRKIQEYRIARLRDRYIPVYIIDNIADIELMSEKHYRSHKEIG